MNWKLTEDFLTEAHVDIKPEEYRNVTETTETSENV